jgi:hypothetical protein
MWTIGKPIPRFPTGSPRRSAFGLTRFACPNKKESKPSAERFGQLVWTTVVLLT